MVFDTVKDALLYGKRCSFEVLKMAFCNVKGHL
ncbi:hypothetical protein HMPREF9138_00477 [Prevotella histicola F0411]|uniref:Uncharacterized protein n=1 Tax=Prevotella histicola F0411 TaxID=857291 RepID=G6AEF0_9BACT|nr:hypothetical protein HMPREF9138_00477 [Prevotella histicola F0411]